MEDLTLNFEGGPIDGSTKSMPIPRDWQVVRYEHRPLSACGVSHVYVGFRTCGQTTVQLAYRGTVFSGGSANE